jgi:succinate-acetate transporter protein
MTLVATTIPPAPASSPASRTVAVGGMLLLVFGVAELALLLLAFRIPRVTVSVLLSVMVAFLVIDAVTALVETGRAPARSMGRVLRALTDLVASAFLLLLGPAWLVRIFGWWAIVTGVVDPTASLVSRPVRVILTSLSIAAGVLLVLGVYRDPVHAMLTIAGYAILAGGIQLYAVRSGLTGRTGPDVR